MKQVTLTVSEQRTLEILTRLDARQFTAPQAAGLLELSVRQVRRKLAAFRQEGAAAVVHHNRGRPPHNALAPELREQILALVRDKYAGFNHHHCQEMLAEFEGLPVSVSTLRRLRLAADLPSPRKRRPAKKRGPRERKPAAGEMLQIDASPFDWLGTGEASNLVAGIDDATGEVFALFREQEDTVGYLQLLRQVAGRRGLPLSVYSDRHTIFLSPRPPTLEEELKGREPLTQFGRAMHELGVSCQQAGSPEAKGRVERLHNTFQDRLANELRLHKIHTREAANAFLPGFLRRYNAKFTVPPVDPQPVWLAPPAELGQALCLKFTRTVAKDHTISFGGVTLSVGGRSGPNYARRQIEIRVALDGRFSYWYQGTCIAKGPRVADPFPATACDLGHRLAQQSPSPVTPARGPAPPPARQPKPVRVPVTPAPDHPWRGRRVAKSEPRR